MIIPPISILSVFIFVTIIFHVIMKGYITEITADSINEEFVLRYVNEPEMTEYSLETYNRIFFSSTHNHSATSERPK